MKRLLLILILQNFAIGRAHSQSFTVDDLITLASLPPKNIDRFMDKNGFSFFSSNVDSNLMVARFIEKVKAKRKDTQAKRSLELYKKDDTRYFSFHTSSLREYLDGERRLIKTGFFYDDKKDVSKETSMLFQKRNITIQAISEIKDDIPQYNFLLQQKEIPDPATIKYAEDLLRFNSHEYLVSFFGEKNVTKDLYFFSEKKLKKCSVLFAGSSRQAVFVWEDENNLDSLSYILVTNIIPTVGAERFKGVISNNQWQFQNGIHAGMAIKELLKLNEKDFEIYGNESELAFMIKPENNGKIDFRKTAIMLSCNNCNNDRLFNKPLIRALDVARENLPMYVYDIIIYPAHH